MAERHQQTDECLKHISELMHRRDTYVEKRMVDLLTTVQGLTLGLTAVVIETAAVPSRRPPMPVAFNSVKTTCSVQERAANESARESHSFLQSMEFSRNFKK